MTAVFQELALGWGGKTYKVTPTMKLLNVIEQDVSLSMVAFRMTKGEPPMSHLATVIGHFLRHAGAKVSDEEVYAELCNGDADAVREAAEAVIMAAFPQVGKPEAPASATPPQPKRKRK